MKRQFSRGMRSGLVGLCALLGLAFSQTALAGIANTKHNLGSTNVTYDPTTGTGGNTFDGTAAICVFCHTPHGADTSASVPLWNRVLSDPATYTTYASLGTTTLDGQVAPVGSVSIACLSCHDGTQAMNVMINAPGSGNYDPAGFTLAGNWSGPASTANGTLGYASIVNIGTDLSNDHPVGIQYGGGGATTGTLNDPDFVTPTTATINGNPVWWVDTSVGTAGVREKTDMILYTRSDLGTAEPFVECASCHNPHTDANPTFLRIANTGSAVCLACHVK